MIVDLIMIPAARMQGRAVDLTDNSPISPPPAS
jgi:hypothetical protein